MVFTKTATWQACLLAIVTDKYYTRLPRLPTGMVPTHVLLLVVLDDVGQVHGVGYNGYLVRRLVAVVEDAAVGTTEQQHPGTRLLQMKQCIYDGQSKMMCSGCAGRAMLKNTVGFCRKDSVEWCFISLWFPLHTGIRLGETASCGTDGNSSRLPVFGWKMMAPFHFWRSLKQ